MATSITDLSGLFKVVYGSKINNLIPETSKLTRAISFSEADKIGKDFEQPVVLTYEHGYTYAAPGAGAFALRQPISMTMKNAIVDGYQGVLRAQMDYETAAKAVAQGEKSFAKATKLQVENMMESATKRLELDMLYGQVGIGAGASSVNQSSTTTLVTISTATWATGIWSGMEGCAITFWKQSDGTLVSSGTDSVFTVTSINVINRTLLVTGSATGISALDTALSAACDIYFDTSRASASSWNQMVGLSKIITNSGTLFNIDGSIYNLWTGNTFDCQSATLTFGKIVQGLARPSGRGLTEKVTVYLNDRTWANVLQDQAALRKFDASYTAEELKNGSRALTFYSQNGEVEIIPYNCIKEGEAYALPLKRMKRIGAQDISFNSLGDEGRIFRELTDSAGFEYRLYADQSIFCETPAKTLKFTNIVNS